MAGPVKLVYEVLGSYSRKSPLLLLHGILGSRSNLKALGRRLSAELETEVYLLDARNHGGSPHVDGMDYDLMCRDLVQFSQDHQLQDPTLIGHSMGGKVAMQLALVYPDYVKKLVVMDVTPIPKSGLSDLRYVLPALTKLDLSLLHSRREVDAALQDSVPDSAMRSFLLKSLQVHSAGKKSRWLFNLEAIARSYSALTGFKNHGKPFSGPSAFIGGSNSPYITSSDYEGIHGLFPEARIFHVSGAGHWLHADQPDQVISIIKNFLLQS